MFSKLKAGIQKAGKDVKGGLEKAGNNIKKNVEGANRSLSDARSHHSTPQKKNSELKSTKSATNARETKSEKPRTMEAASEHKSASAPESHQSAARASSVHSDQSSRASLRETAVTPAQTPMAPRSRAGTPVPPPPPPTKTPKRVSERPSSATSTAPSATARAGTSTTTTAAVVLDEPEVKSRSASAESGNSLHFSEADEMETPGSIRFTSEPGSALRKEAPAPPKAKNATAALPQLTPVAELVKQGRKKDDVVDDLTTESSLDIAIEEDDDTQPHTEDIVDEVQAQADESTKAAKAKSSSVKTEEKKSAASRKSAKVEIPSSRKPTPPTKTAPAAAASAKSKESVVHSSKSKDKKREDKKAASPRGSSKHEVTFADEALKRSRVVTHKKAPQQGKGSAHEDDNSEKPDSPASSHSRSPSSCSGASEADHNGHVGATREESKQQRQHRGFRLSPARDDNGRDGDAEVQPRPPDSAKEKKPKRLPRHRPSSDNLLSPSLTCDVSRERRRELRHGDGHHARASPSTAQRTRSPPRRHSSQRRRESDGSDDSVEDVGHARHSRSGARTPLSSSATRRRGSASRRNPVRLMDGGALVEECLRDTEEYARVPARRRLSPGSRAGEDGETIQHRTAVQSTYQQDYADWSRRDELNDARRPVTYRNNNDDDDDHDDAYGDAGGRGGAYRGYEALRGPLSHARGGQSSHTRNDPPISPHRAMSRRGHAASPSSSFHRLSFYDEDDVLAAEAVAEPERFREHSARRERRTRHRRTDNVGAGGEEAIPRGRSCSGSSIGSVDERRGDSEGWHTRRRSFDVAGRRPRVPSSARDTSPHYASRYISERNVAQSPLSGRHMYDAPRPRSPPHTSSRRRSTVDRTEDVPNLEAWHRVPEDRADPDYYFSDAPRDRQESASWRSRSRMSAFAPSPPRTPLWAHRSTFGRPALVVSASSNRPSHHRVGATTPKVSPQRGRRNGSATRHRSVNEVSGGGSALCTSVRSRPTSAHSAARSEEEILDEVEWKLDVLGQQIAEEDQDRERAMLRSPFERLYHLNNRRDRDERRKKVFQLNRLERIRDRIVSGSLEEDIARKEERLRKQEEMLTNPNGVFLRLYQNTSGRRSKAGESVMDDGSSRHSTPQHSGRANPDASGVSNTSSRPGSATRRTLSREQRNAMCDRLYGGALAGKGKKDEKIKQASEERRQREVEDLLVARLAAQMQLEHARLRPKDKKPPLTFAELETGARLELEKLCREDPTGYEEKLLRGRVLTAKEQGLMSSRLFRQGYVPKEKLAARKAEEELRGCTFQPEVNSYAAFGGAKVKRREGGSDSSGDNDSDDAESRNGSSDAEERHHRHTEADRCQELYRKGMKAKAREAGLRDERDRETRLRILRGRMANDHHFRRRVELDPALAERFMKSLVV